jgi:hypothetical protein
MLTENTNEFVSSKNLKKSYVLRKSRGRHRKETKTRSYSDNKFVIGKSRKKSCINFTKQKWSKKNAMIALQSHHLIHPKLVAIAVY